MDTNVPRATNTPVQGAELRMDPMKLADLTEAVEVVTLAMADNPVPKAVFRKRRTSVPDRQRFLFQMALTMDQSQVWLARKGAIVVGVMCFVPSAHCQLRPSAFPAMLPGLLKGFGRSLLRVLRWRLNWKKHDHRAAHMHFGPLAVHPDWQGQGVGSALLHAFCKEMDRTGQSAYLETDKAANLPLYRKFGFQVIAEDQLFGLPNWFMLRLPTRIPEQRRERAEHRTVPHKKQAAVAARSGPGV